MSEYLICLMSFFAVYGAINVLSPKGDMEKYIKFLCGICVLCIIAGPVLSALRGTEEVFSVLEDPSFETSEEYYNELFEKYLSDGAASEISAFAEDKISEELGIKKEGFDISVILEKENGGRYILKQAVLKILPYGIAIDAQAAARKAEELLGCSCTIIDE